ncbi:vacuolar transporter chaperone [Gryganskiella cystojenkinii]|nr:vacuolar transporter chaperone [Gryganskiella cystojenkinii]
MKFGSQLKAHRAPHWKYHFVDYDGLKAHLKSKSQDREFTEEDEVQFIKLLDAELDKVASFQTPKLGEVQRRTEHCEFTIQQHQAATSSRSPDKLTLASFVVTESEINKITQDLQDLARFQRLNYTAFLKIVKKHDKHTGFALRRTFMNGPLKQQPFHKERFDPLVGRLSTLYNIVRTGTAPAVSKARSIDSSLDEEEAHLQLQRQLNPVLVKKTAFWVHPDSLMDLKMLILKYLPLVVYEPMPTLNSSSHRSTSSQLNACLTSESPVSTIYLDNPELDLYMAQVEHRERTESVRLRWYGSERKQIWVEHQQKDQQHTSSSDQSSSQESTTTEPIVTRHRFQIKSKNVPELLQGSAKLNKIVEQMRRSGQKSEEEIEHFKASTERVQSRIQQKGLQPAIQTFFNRTAFQVPGDARVRITIDTDVVMVRERAAPNPSTPATSLTPAMSEETVGFERPSWAPTKELKAEDYPFPELGEEDSGEIVRFPYAIMQIRTLTDAPQDEDDEEAETVKQAMSWVDRIAQSHLVEMVPNFTKDQHAIATLYESRVGLLPFWLSDMDRDIRKPMMLTGRDVTTQQDSASNSSQASSSNDSVNSTATATSATTMSEAGGSPPSGTGSKSSSLSSSSSNPLNIINHMKGKTKGGLGELLRSSKSKQEQKQRRKSVLEDPYQYHDLSISASSSTKTRISPPPSVTFHEEVQDLVAVNRMMVERQSGAGSSEFATIKKEPHHPKKKPVVSCLKKYGSQSSLQGPLSPLSPVDYRRGRTSTISSTSGYGSGYGSGSSSQSSPNRHQKRVTFKKSPARLLFDKCTAWVPIASVRSLLRLDTKEQEEDILPSYLVQDLEAQSRRVLPRTLSQSSNITLVSEEQERKRTQQARRRKLARWFWTGLDCMNIALLFVGLVFALMNLGDGVGLEVASLFLVISCLCMGSTVWAHLIRMDGAHAHDEDHSELTDAEDSDAAPYSTKPDERTGLLSANNHSSQFEHAGYRGRWVRTRLMPIVTFACLATVVVLNAWVRVGLMPEHDESD